MKAFIGDQGTYMNCNLDTTILRSVHALHFESKTIESKVVDILTRKREGGWRWWFEKRRETERAELNAKRNNKSTTIKASHFISIFSSLLCTLPQAPPKATVVWKLEHFALIPFLYCPQLHFKHPSSPCLSPSV